MSTEKQYPIGELTVLTGISRRAVRYYIQRGLVPPPLGAGRGHYYTEDHLTRIRAIRELQAQGLSLDEIEERFRIPQPDLFSHEIPFEHSQLSFVNKEDTLTSLEEDEPVLFTKIKVAEGIDLTIEGGTYRLSPGRLKKLQKAARDILGPAFSAAERNEEGEGE